jgi:C4-dicarboxylate-specific signal transduction histidine kinase
LEGIAIKAFGWLIAGYPPLRWSRLSHPLGEVQQFRDFISFDVKDVDGATPLQSLLKAIVHPDDLATVGTLFARSLATGEAYALKHRQQRFDGQYRWVETRAAATRDAKGAIAQWNIICLDIDGELQTQEELRLARERLARASQATSLAELSASIAHEVNQPLAAIVANSHACHRWLSAEPANVERAKITAERIIRDANSAADVVSRIRALFRQSTEARNSTAFSGSARRAAVGREERAAWRKVHLRPAGRPESRGMTAGDPIKTIRHSRRAGGYRA